MSLETKPTAKVTISNTGLGTLLTVLFIGLKLTNQIDWSWVWVLSPLWIPTALILTFVGCWMLAGLLLDLFTHKKG